MKNKLCSKILNKALLAPITLLLGIILNISTTQSLRAEELTLEIARKQYTLTQIKNLVKEKTVYAIEPHLKDNVAFVGFSVDELLEKTIGTDWKNADGMLYSCIDGYRSDIAVERVKLFKPYLVYKFKDGRPFKVNVKSQNEKDVELGPFYLVWDNIAFPILNKDSAYGWPYQVNKIEFISYDTHYAKVFPFKGRDSEVLKPGFEAFKSYCMTCHALKGEGGEKGPALWPNENINKLGYAKFEKWVLDPQREKEGTTMPALNPQLPLKNRKIAAKKIYEYLKGLNSIK